MPYRSREIKLGQGPIASDLDREVGSSSLNSADVCLEIDRFTTIPVAAVLKIVNQFSMRNINDSCTFIYN